MKRRFYRTFEILLFLLGIFFIVNSRENITGAAIGVQISGIANLILGTALVLVSIVLSVYERLEDRTEFRQDIKSFRRWLEKKDHCKYSYQQAEEEYNELEKRYMKAVERGVVTKSYHDRPLEYIEKYADNLRKLAEESAGRNVPISKALSIIKGKESAQYLAENRIPSSTEEFKRLATRDGYYLTKSKEGFKVRDENDVIITVIPKHDISKEVRKNILKSMATGKSSFRQHQHQ